MARKVRSTWPCGTVSHCRRQRRRLGTADIHCRNASGGSGLASQLNKVRIARARITGFLQRLIDRLGESRWHFLGIVPGQLALVIGFDSRVGDLDPGGGAGGCCHGRVVGRGTRQRGLATSRDDVNLAVPVGLNRNEPWSRSAVTTIVVSCRALCSVGLAVAVMNWNGGQKVQSSTCTTTPSVASTGLSQGASSSRRRVSS